MIPQTRRSDASDNTCLPWILCSLSQILGIPLTTKELEWGNLADDVMDALAVPTTTLVKCIHRSLTLWVHLPSKPLS